MAVSLSGEAMFSTRLGRFLPREAVEPRGPIVLRSEPEDDLESVTTRLERDFRNPCKEVTLPITNIYEYFDHYDCHVLGTGFLHKVLENIVLRNLTKSQHVQGLVNRWKEGKLAGFKKMKAAQSPQHIFTATEVEEYGVDILEEAFSTIKSIMNLGLDREEAQHRGKARVPNAQQNIAKDQNLAPIPSAQPRGNLSAPRSSHMSYAIPEVSEVPTRRSSSALGKPSDEAPKEVPNPSPRQGQAAKSRKDCYSKSTDSEPQMAKQDPPGESIAQLPRAPPIHTQYYLTPSGIEIPPNTVHTSIYQPPLTLQYSIAKKPPSMGFTNDVRNLINPPTTATTTPFPPVQQAMYMPYQSNPSGGKDQYRRDVGGFRPGAGFDQTQRVFSGYPATSSFGGNNTFDHVRHLPNDHPSVVPFSPYAGGRGSHRHSFSNQAQSPFHQPATANNLGMTSPVLLPAIYQYRHSSTGQLSSQVPWSHEGSFSASPNSATAMSFPEQQRTRQNGSQRKTYQAQGGSRPLDGKTLWIGWVAGQVDLCKLRSMFARCGTIEYIGPSRKSFAFVKYKNASDAAEAIELYNGKSLDILGGSRNHKLTVQLAGGPKEDYLNREGGRIQAFSTFEGSPSKQHQMNSSSSNHGGDRRRASVVSYVAETSRAYPDGNHGRVSGSAGPAGQLYFGDENITARRTESVRMPSQIDPGLLQFNISPQEASVKLPSPVKPKAIRQDLADSKINYQDKSTMTNPPFAAQEGSYQRRSNQEHSANPGSDLVSNKENKSESPVKPRDENRLAASRSIKEEDSKPSTEKPYVVHAKATPAPLEKLSDKDAKPKSGETTSILMPMEMKPADPAELQTLEHKPIRNHSRDAPAGQVKAKREGKKPAPAHSGKKPDRSNKSKTGERKEQFKNNAKPITTNTSPASTVENPTTLRAVSGLESPNNLAAKDKEARSPEAGLETLAAFTDSTDSPPSKEAATAEQQNQPINLSWFRADRGSTKHTESGDRFLFISTEPATSAYSEQPKSRENGSQGRIATSTAKWLPLTPSHHPSKANMKPILKSAVENTSNLEALAAVAERMEYVQVNETRSVAAEPSTSEASPPGPVPVNQVLALPNEPFRALPNGKLNPRTTTMQAQSIGTNDSGSKGIIEAPSLASADIANDRALGIPFKASTNTPDDIVSPQLADLPSDTGFNHRPEIPARSSSLVTPATPIMTHMKKQRNLKSPQIATENPYAALIPETPGIPLVENTFPKEGELPQANFADPFGHGSHHVKSLEQDRKDKVEISHDQRGTLAAKDEILKTGKLAHDQDIPLNEEKAGESQAGTLQAATSPSTDRVKGHKKAPSKSKKKKLKGSKASISSISTTAQPGSAAMAPRTLPQPETPFVTDDLPSLPSPKTADRLSTEGSSEHPKENNKMPDRPVLDIDSYYNQKTNRYDPKLHQAMKYVDRAANTAVPDPPSESATPPGAKVEETTEDVIATYRRSGYLAPEKSTCNTPTSSPPQAVGPGQALDAFGIYADSKTSDSDGSSLSTLGAPKEDLDDGRVRKSSASTDLFQKQVTEVDTKMQKKPNPRGLALPVRSKADLGPLPDQEEVLSQLTPDAQKAFLKIQGQPSTPPAGRSSVLVTPTRPKQSVEHILSPQAMAMFDQLDPEHREAAAIATVEFGLRAESIADKVASFSPAERREVAMLEAQYSGRSLPLSEVSASLTKSPSKEDLHKIAEEMSKLEPMSKAMVTDMIEQRVSSSGSPAKLTSFRRKLSAVSAAYSHPPTPPRPAHAKLPSYSKAIASPPKESTQLAKRSSGNLPTLAPGTTLEVTETGFSSSTSSMATLTSTIINPHTPSSSRPTRAGSQDPPRYRQGPTGRSNNNRRRRAATQEGRERPFTERMDREHWGAERHERAHHDEMDPWGVPKGEKAWGVRSSR